MKDTALFTQLLGLYPPWRITAITPDLSDKSITIHIGCPKETPGLCSDCNTLYSVYDREQRAWRHLDARNRAISFFLRPLFDYLCQKYLFSHQTRLFYPPAFDKNPFLPVPTQKAP